MEVIHNETKTFNIISKYRQNLYQIKNILLENEIYKIKNLDKDEWAYVFIYSNCRLIIPCKFIIKHFYLKNKTLEKALRSGNINHLFYNFSFESSNFESSNMVIYNERQCSSITALFIARILFDKRIENIFYYHFFQLCTTKNQNLNKLRSFFPTFGKIEINGNFTKIIDKLKKNTYVLESFSPYTNLKGPFNDVIYFDYIKNQKIRKEFSSLIDINIDPNRIYYKSDETYFLYKSYFNDKYLSLNIYLTNLGCKITYLSSIKYLHEYVDNFNNYDKSTIYNYCFYYLAFNFNFRNYLLIFFDENELNNIWLFENFHKNIFNIDKFLRNIFDYIYMSIEKININLFCKKYSLNFQLINKYQVFPKINTKKYENLNIKEIIEMALFNLDADYNKQFDNTYLKTDQLKRTTRNMRRIMKLNNEPVRYFI